MHSSPITEWPAPRLARSRRPRGGPRRREDRRPRARRGSPTRSASTRRGSGSARRRSPRARWICSMYSPSMFVWLHASHRSRAPRRASRDPRIELGQRERPVVLGVTQPEHVQVHPVAAPRPSSRSAPATAARTALSADDAHPRARRPGRRTSTKGTPSPSRFLSSVTARSTASTLQSSSRVGSPRSASSAPTSLAQLRPFGQSQRREHPERHRLTVAVTPVSGGGLDRVTDRVAEVQHLTAAGVPFVLRDDRQLRAHAAERSHPR